MARNPKQDANLKPPFDSNQSREEASKNGRKGGLKSGEARRLRKDAKKTIQYIMQLDAAAAVKANLEKAEIPEDAHSNMTATWVKCFTDYLRTGDIRLLEALMRYGGFDEAELRKARESEARVEAMNKSGIPVGAEPESGNRSDVLIVLPDDGRGAPGAKQVTQREADFLIEHDDR